MNTQSWLRRLVRDLPGWHVWYSTPAITPGLRWNAVPAAADATHDAAIQLPNRIAARTPQELRSVARDRYGWHDYCATCGVPARECGHRQPELRSAP